MLEAPRRLMSRAFASDIEETELVSRIGRESEALGGVAGVDPVKPDTRRVGTECTREVTGSRVGNAGARCCSPPSSYR